LLEHLFQAESGFRRRAGTPPPRPFPAVRPTVAYRPIEASKAAVGYDCFTSTPARRGGSLTTSRTGADEEPTTVRR
jgi:hypothetical protein